MKWSIVCLFVRSFDWLIDILQKKEVYSEFERRLDECERQRVLYDNKLITYKDMAPDICLHGETKGESLFSQTVSLLSEYRQ